MPRCFAPLVLPLALAGAVAQAQVADLQALPDQSSVEATICVTPDGLGRRCDTDSSAARGPIAIELDDYDAPGEISIHDFDIALDDDLEYNFDWGFFVGGIDITITDLRIRYATPGTPTGPVPVDGAGAFAFPSVQAVVTGTGAYRGYGLILEGLVGEGSFNLADFGVVESAIAGSVAVSGGVVELRGAQAFTGEGDFDGATVSIDGAATLVAVGDVPDCVADFNGDGQVNTQDVLAFLNAWTAGDPRADCTGDGTINTQDVLCFLNAWTAGC
jgi:hypothetical protein